MKPTITPRLTLTLLTGVPRIGMLPGRGADTSFEDRAAKYAAKLTPQIQDAKPDPDKEGFLSGTEGYARELKECGADCSAAGHAAETSEYQKV